MSRILGMIFCLLLLPTIVFAQSASPVPSTPVQAVQHYYGLAPISSTAGSATQTTLTIPAPPTGLYNYICSLTFNYTQTNTTGTVETNAVTTSTNFNSFALKFSSAVLPNGMYEWAHIFGTPGGGGCAKSVSPATATTFVSPAGATNGQFTWYATYFQAP